MVTNDPSTWCDSTVSAICEVLVDLDVRSSYLLQQTEKWGMFDGADALIERLTAIEDEIDAECEIAGDGASRITGGLYPDIDRCF